MEATYSSSHLDASYAQDLSNQTAHGRLLSRHPLGWAVRSGGPRVVDADLMIEQRLFLRTYDAVKLPQDFEDMGIHIETQRQNEVNGVHGPSEATYSSSHFDAICAQIPPNQTAHGLLSSRHRLGFVVRSGGPRLVDADLLI